MADYGARYTDKKIREADRRLKETYRQAQRELKKKLADFNARFDKKDAEMRRQVQDGKITKDDYRKWLTGQVFMREQWKSKIRETSEILYFATAVPEQ